MCMTRCVGLWFVCLPGHGLVDGAVLDCGDRARSSADWRRRHASAKNPMRGVVQWWTLHSWVLCTHPVHHQSSPRPHEPPAAPWLLQLTAGLRLARNVRIDAQCRLNVSKYKLPSPLFSVRRCLNYTFPSYNLAIVGRHRWPLMQLDCSEIDHACNTKSASV